METDFDAVCRKLGQRSLSQSPSVSDAFRGAAARVVDKFWLWALSTGRLDVSDLFKTERIFTVIETFLSDADVSESSIRVYRSHLRNYAAHAVEFLSALPRTSAALRLDEQFIPLAQAAISGDGSEVLQNALVMKSTAQCYQSDGAFLIVEDCIYPEALRNFEFRKSRRSAASRHEVRHALVSKLREIRDALELWIVKAEQTQGLEELLDQLRTLPSVILALSTELPFLCRLVRECIKDLSVQIQKYEGE